MQFFIAIYTIKVWHKNNLWFKLQFFSFIYKEKQSFTPNKNTFLYFFSRKTHDYSFINNQVADMTGFTVFLALNIAAELSVQFASFLHQVMLKSLLGMHFDAT